MGRIPEVLALPAGSGRITVRCRVVGTDRSVSLVVGAGRSDIEHSTVFRVRATLEGGVRRDGLSTRERPQRFGAVFGG